MENATEVLENTLNTILAQIDASEIQKFQKSKRQNGCLSEAVQSTLNKIEDSWEALNEQLSDVKAYCAEVEKKIEMKKEVKIDLEEELEDQKLLLEGCEKVAKCF